MNSHLRATIRHLSVGFGHRSSLVARHSSLVTRRSSLVSVIKDTIVHLIFIKPAKPAGLNGLTHLNPFTLYPK